MEQALAAIVGAVMVALITAVTTDRRLRKQLEAEAARQERAIDAQEARQRAELEAADERHTATIQAERDLADLADERKLLDDVAAAMYRANDAVGDVQVAVRQHGRRVGEQDADMLANLRQCGRDLDTLLARASIRFEAREAVLTSLNMASGWLSSISIALAWLEDDDAASWKTKREGIEADVERWGKTLQQFERDAVYRVGSRPHMSF